MWQHYVGDGLWHAYSGYIQHQISQALTSKEDSITVEINAVPVTLHFGRLTHREGDASQAMRCQIQNLFLHRTGEAGWGVTTDLSEVPDWDAACVLCSAGGLSVTAPDRLTLGLLADRYPLPLGAPQPHPHAQRGRGLRGGPRGG